MNVAISGSRTFTDEPFVQRVVERLLRRGDFIIVGDAPSGVDLFVAQYLLPRQRMDRAWRRYIAHWTRFGRSAGHERNGRMIHDADELIAIFAPGLPLTPGTSDAVTQAVEKGIVIHIYHDDAWQKHDPRARARL